MSVKDFMLHKDDIDVSPVAPLSLTVAAVAKVPPLFDPTKPGFNTLLQTPLPMTAMSQAQTNMEAVSYHAGWCQSEPWPNFLSLNVNGAIYLWRMVMADDKPIEYGAAVVVGSKAQSFTIPLDREWRGRAFKELQQATKDDHQRKALWTSFKLFRYALFRHELRCWALGVSYTGKHSVSVITARAITYAVQQKWLTLQQAAGIRHTCGLGGFTYGITGLSIKSPDGLIGSGDDDSAPKPKNHPEPLYLEPPEPDFTKEPQLTPAKKVKAAGPMSLKPALSTSSKMSECETVGAVVSGTSSNYRMIMPYGAWGLRLAARLHGLSAVAGNMSLRLERAGGAEIEGAAKQFVDEIGLFDVKGLYASAHIDGTLIKLAMAYGAVCAALHHGANADTPCASWKLFRSWH